MLHLRFLRRELIQTRGQGLIFVLCLALSLTTLIALNSFKNDVHHAILTDARTLQGGDIIVHSHQEFSPPLTQAINQLIETGQAIGARNYEFYSVVQTEDQNNSLLAKLKIVNATFYPLYGDVRLRSGRPLAKVLNAGHIIVEQDILDRMHLAVGAALRVGGAELTIADIVDHEPDRPVNFFALGPRIFVAAADMDKLDLIKKGSRIEHQQLLKLSRPADIDPTATHLRELSIPGQERVETFKTARSGVKRFFDNLLFFLSLISIFTLLLSGIGMQSALAALLRERVRSMAIIKALGGSRAFLLGHYLLVVLFLGLIGILLGVTAGYLIKLYLPGLFAGMIPGTFTPRPKFADFGEGVLIALPVLIIFTFLPLQRLGDLKPVTIFTGEISAGRGRMSTNLVRFAGLIVLTFLVIRQIDDLKTGLYFMLGSFVLIAICALCSRAILALCRRIPTPVLSLRQAVRSLFRPGNATGPIIITLTAALTLLLTIALVQKNLYANFIASYPADAPNLFCIDIQPDQLDEFAASLPTAAQYFPIIRARLLAINHIKINREQELRKRRDNLLREFNLTYRQNLLEDEVMLSGQTLFGTKPLETGVVPVSILDTVADMGAIHLHDLLDFNIQGVPLQARVTSIRTRNRSKLYPYFYFVFPGEVLKSAPQTIFAALKVDKESVANLENRIVGRFPNISVINMSETAASLGSLMKKLAGIINFFALFSILSGVLILVSSLVATRLDRVREAVYYKILGADSGFVLTSLVAENILLGLCSSIPALFMAQTASLSLCYFFFDIDYQPHFGMSLLALLATVFLFIVIGVTGSLSVVRHRPGDYLRQQTDT